MASAEKNANVSLIRVTGLDSNLPPWNQNHVTPKRPRPPRPPRLDLTVGVRGGFGTKADRQIWINNPVIDTLGLTWWNSAVVSLVSLIMFNLKLYQLTERLQPRDLVSRAASSSARSSRGHAITTRTHSHPTLPGELQQDCGPFPQSSPLLRIPNP